jgi:hypothetical protein
MDLLLHKSRAYRDGTRLVLVTKQFDAWEAAALLVAAGILFYLGYQLGRVSTLAPHHVHGVAYGRFGSFKQEDGLPSQWKVERFQSNDDRVPLPTGSTAGSSKE